MKPPTSLSALTTPCDVAVVEVRASLDEVPRGGPSWDPFRKLPELRLSTEAQSQLLSVFLEAQASEENAESGLVGARSVRMRNELSRTVYQMSSVRTWAQEALLGSVSLLLVKRVQLALKRHGRAAGEYGSDYMSEALACALACLSTCPSDARFHLYVASSVDACLSQKLLEGSMAETLPNAWQVALRHIPSIEAEVQTRHGRTASDEEVAELLLVRARTWAEARIVEKGGDVEEDILAELVDAKLTKQGMFSAARNIKTIRAATAGTLSLDAEGSELLMSQSATSGADVDALSSDAGGALRRLLAPMPWVTGDDLAFPTSATDDVRGLLESSLWRTLAGGGGPAITEARVSRGAPDILADISA